MKGKEIFALLIIFILGVSSNALARDPKKVENITLYFENDTFGGTDKDYTNAVKLTWTSADIDEYSNGYSRKKVPLMGGLWGEEGYQRNFSFSIGQNIYTPENTDAVELVEDERPYAGFLYTSFALHRKNIKMLDTLELTLGVIGPSSKAEETQKFVHDLLDIDSPAGWDNQLGDELGIALAWQRNWRAAAGGGGTGWGWDTIPYFGLTVGNIATFANAGLGVRFGYNIPLDFGTSLIRPAGAVPVPTNEADPRLNEHRDFGIVWFVRAEGRAVAHNVFLDGSTFEDSHSVDKEHFVADLSAGISIIYKAVKLTYAQVHRTEEYEQQDSGHTFASIALSITY